MSYAWRIPATALAVVCVIVVSIASAEARSTARKTTNRASQQTYQQSFGSQPPASGPYDRYHLPPGGGINFNDGRSGANYNGGG